MNRTTRINPAVKLAALLIGLAMAFGMAMATPSPNGPGQPGAPGTSCGDTDATLSPGNSVTAPGSAFNPSGQAGSVYAGNNPFAPGFVNGDAKYPCNISI